MFIRRTATCGELRESDIGRKVVLNGWVSNLRDLGKIIFIDLRDRYGITQLVVQSDNEELIERIRAVKSEYVIWASGQVRLRENINPKIPTGKIEVLLDDFGIINRSELPPLEISDTVAINEDLRLRYRYLDLRRPSVQHRFIVRNKVYQLIHQYFQQHNFVEVETPYLTKSTPEGARDFLVPSRLHKGKFYALPQSPQLYKQILMIAGFDRYVQIVKCFRDEDLRSDRQPEFTQIDVEMSFVEPEDIFELTEGLFKLLWKEILGISIETPFPRLSYHEALHRFGTDKPDLRYGLELIELTDIFQNSDFKIFKDIISTEGIIYGINAKGCANYSRKQIEQLAEVAKKYGAHGLSWFKLQNGILQSPIAKYFSQETLKKTVERAKMQDNDLLLVISDSEEECLISLGAIRKEIAKNEGVLEKVKNNFSFVWIVDFPLFEYSAEEKRLVAKHHPFTSPKDEYLEILSTQPLKVYAKAYDIVVNGNEVGGGSIRNHNYAVQQQIFQLLNLTNEEVEDKFGFLIEALQYGAPPHGGIAFGLDRIVMTLTNTENIRDVIPFPKTTSGLSLMDNCPSTVDPSQLEELGIQVTTKSKDISLQSNEPRT
ncbi:MAG: aspartate--tRNA ligase [Candidatus Kapaibacteriales bacterium]